ncbi:type III secretion protein [Enterobacter cloacae]|uniref:type III secretion protein n=1 Tax=Enterobacter cloacae TaxID=550 RepID=UPI002FF9B9AB
MRVITIDTLPEDWNQLTVIKSAEKTRYMQISKALERTLSRCSEINKENELEVVKLRDNAEKMGFLSGFQLFISNLLIFIKEYKNLQDNQQSLFREQIATAISASLHDPMIVEYIINLLKEHSGTEQVQSIFIPRTIKLPESIDITEYQYTDDNHITVQYGAKALRFPCDSLCHDWLERADNNLIATTSTIDNLTPDLLRELAGTLIAMSHQSPTTHAEEDSGNV